MDVEDMMQEQDAHIDLHIVFLLGESSIEQSELDQLYSSEDQEDKEKLKSIVIIAASNDNHELVIHLLRQGYQVDVLNDKIQTLAHIAYYNDTHNILQRSEGLVFSSCKNYSNYVDSNGLSHLHIACATGYVDVVKQFLDNGEDIHARLNADCNGDRNGFTPLHFAVAHHQIEVVKLLLERGADINATDSSGCTPLHLICAVSWDFRKFTDRESLTASTSWMAELDVLKLLLERNCDLNTRDENGNTPMLSIFKNDYYSSTGRAEDTAVEHDCVIEELASLLRTRQLEKCKLLLVRGVDFTARNRIDESILHCVIEDLTSQRFSVAPFTQYLHDKCYAVLIWILLGANEELNANAKNAKGETPVSLAVSLTSYDIVKALVDHGADLSSIKIDGHHFFRHPNLMLSLEMVNNLIRTITTLHCRGFKLNLADLLTIMKFLAHNVDDCDCGFACQTVASSMVISQCLIYDSSAHLKRVVTKVCEGSDDTTKQELLTCLQASIEYSKLISYPLLVDEEVLQIARENLGDRGIQSIAEKLQQPVPSDLSFMKSTKFMDGLSIYDFLTKCSRVANIAMYVASHQGNFPKDYLLERPINGLFIIGHLAKVTLRTYIETSALKNYVSFVFPLLPDLCHRKILGYLDIEDILRMCEAALLE